MRKLKKVYVAGPYTHGDVEENVAAAMLAADALIRAGMAPYVPHLWHFQHAAYLQPYEVWTALDMEWLRVCDAVVRIPGRSPGADAEVAEARRLGIPVFGSVEEAVRELAAAPPAKAFAELREAAGPDAWGDDPVAAIQRFREAQE